MKSQKQQSLLGFFSISHKRADSKVDDDSKDELELNAGRRKQGNDHVGDENYSHKRSKTAMEKENIQTTSKGSIVSLEDFKYDDEKASGGCISGENVESTRVEENDITRSVESAGANDNSEGIVGCSIETEEEDVDGTQDGLHLKDGKGAIDTDSKVTSDYEQLRAENIRRNAEFLASLGLESVKPQVPSPVSVRVKSIPKKKLPIQQSSLTGGLRRSARNVGDLTLTLILALMLILILTLTPILILTLTLTLT